MMQLSKEFKWPHIMQRTIIEGRKFYTCPSKLFNSAKMKIGIQWQCGLLRIDIMLSDKMDKLLDTIAEQTHVPRETIELFFDGGFTEKINLTGTVCNAKIKKNTIIYMKSAPPTEKVAVAQMALPADVHSQFLQDGEEMPSHLKRIKSNYGGRVVTGAFFEHSNKMKPYFDGQTESSCFAIRLGLEAIKPFQNYAFQTGFEKHRLIFLFGRINEITGKVTVHCGMEPQQRNYKDHLEISEDFDINVPLEIAHSFGMEMVGMAISHPCNDPNHPVTEYMLKMASKYQSEITEYFTTVTVTPKLHKGVQSVELQAFQMNDCCMKLAKLDLFDYSPSETKMCFKEGIKVGAGAKRYTELDVNLGLCAVRVRPARSHFPSHSFPSPSAHPSVIDLGRHMMDNQYCPPWRQLFDFNLLVYLVQTGILGMGDVSDVVCRIITKEKIPKTLMNKINASIPK